MNWADYPNFPKADHDCKHTGQNRMHPEHMARLQKLRSVYNKPMPVSSGYRDPSHPNEAGKAAPGEHTHGRATDVRVSGPDALRLIVLAVQCGFTRIGVQQKGSVRFIHLGDSPDFPSTIWSYP